MVTLSSMGTGGKNNDSDDDPMGRIPTPPSKVKESA